MPFDASGNFTRSYNFQQDRDNGIKVLSARVDGEFDNFATGMNLVFFRDGRVPMTADLRMNTNRVTGLADGSVAAPAVRFNTQNTTGPYLDGLSRYAIAVASSQKFVATTAGVDITGNITATGTISTGGQQVATLTRPAFAIAGGTLSSTHKGAFVVTTAGVTVPNAVFGAGDIVEVYNNTAGNITLTQQAGLTQRLAGSATTGNLTLAQRGVAKIRFIGASEAVVEGNVS